MKFERSSGILLHPSSLPGPYGIGDIGPAAYHWVDWLTASGVKLWQVLPLGPTGYGDSPYQCFSAFAGNPYLVSPDLLIGMDLLTNDDLTDMPAWEARHVDYGQIYQWKPVLLARAYTHFLADPEPILSEFEAFLAENAAWLDDYALFMALKEVHGGGPWNEWPEPLRQRDPAVLDDARRSLAERVSLYSFTQFLFFRQWYALKGYANEHGIQIIGDIPLFVAYDSSEVWAHPELFFLDQDGAPTGVAGVPPDYFSPTGQLWGNPLYRWDVHKTGGYAWWLDRIRAAFKLVDRVRIDHFRGFAGYWEIPAGSPTAEHGHWVDGPGADLFSRIQSTLGDLPIIAEDLGVITPDVVALRDLFGFPGMKVLQFAFSGPDNVFLPHFYPQNSVVYTGTHDNDTSRGWYESASEDEKNFARRYLRVDGRDIAWDLIRAGWGSTAASALAPMQDLLGLGTEARMNFPSHLGGNWEWRMTEADFNEDLQSRIKELNWLYHR
jgi:4-alpha-glucanotransferase